MYRHRSQVVVRSVLGPLKWGWFPHNVDDHAIVSVPGIQQAPLQKYLASGRSQKKKYGKKTPQKTTTCLPSCLFEIRKEVFFVLFFPSQNGHFFKENRLGLKIKKIV